ncbi:FecR family protein [Lacibacter luteus]|nr:FecR family protein [Lacibacter luteus]
MTTERLHYLLERYLSRSLNPAEEKEFYLLVDSGLHDDALKTMLGNEWYSLQTDARLSEEKAEQLFQSILQQRPAVQLSLWQRSVALRRFAAAASIISFIVLSVFFFTNNKSEKQSTASAVITSTNNDIPPGQSGAILKMADGSTLVLDSVQDGVLTQQGDAVAIKQGGQLNYAQQANNANGNAYNSVETPRGRQFKLTLEDGTQVWLNASSSIRFPVAFTGTERKVEITGEVYFEVAKNKVKPFIVQTGTTKVEVLGTHFNINAYDDEAAVKTTLVEGSVRISKGNSNGILKPGQQAQASGANTLQIRNDADIEEVLSWKNGRFAFVNADLETIMRQISKWYDVDVQYAGVVPKRTFTADLSRNTNLSELLKVLELNNIHFLVQGRKLTVMP